MSEDRDTMACPECGATIPVEREPGVWVAYCSDRSGVYLFATEIEALRYAVGYCMMVKFAEFGKEVLS